MYVYPKSDWYSIYSWQGQQDEASGSGIPSRPLTSGRKFLSRSHNSLMTLSFRRQPTPDYSKVESKVKKYIDAMKAQKSNKKRSETGNLATTQLTVSTSPVTMSDAKWEEQEERIRILQEDHDRLFLANARLQNQLDEMRAKIRAQEVQGAVNLSPQRRTNSPSPVSSSTDDPEISSASTTYVALPAIAVDPRSSPKDQQSKIFQEIQR